MTAKGKKCFCVNLFQQESSDQKCQNGNFPYLPTFLPAPILAIVTITNLGNNFVMAALLASIIVKLKEVGTLGRVASSS